MRWPADPGQYCTIYVLEYQYSPFFWNIIYNWRRIIINRTYELSYLRNVAVIVSDNGLWWFFAYYTLSNKKPQAFASSAKNILLQHHLPTIRCTEINESCLLRIIYPNLILMLMILICIYHIVINNWSKINLLLSHYSWPI